MTTYHYYTLSYQGELGSNPPKLKTLPEAKANFDRVKKMFDASGADTSTMKIVLVTMKIEEVES